MIDTIFDLDGTLVDSARQCEEIIAAMRRSRGADSPVSVEMCARYAGIAGPVMVPALLGNVAGDGDADLKEFRERYAALVTPEDAIYPGVREGLAALAANQNIRLSVCSAKPQRLCERVLDDLGLRKFFAAVVGGDAPPACKPDAVHLEETLRRLGGRADRAILVGDTVTDQELARNAGVPFVYANYGYSKPDDLFDTSRIAVDFDEVTVFIEQYEAGFD